MSVVGLVVGEEVGEEVGEGVGFVVTGVGAPVTGIRLFIKTLFLNSTLVASKVNSLVAALKDKILCCYKVQCNI